MCAPDAILATNTSALSVTQIAEATERPERVIGMHFFNPAPLLPLVEIVRTEQSDESVVDAAYAWAERAGKQPVRCNDTPGFIVNRDPHPAPERLRARARRGRGEPRGSRQGDDERRRLADGAVRADRPDRDRHPRPRLRGAARLLGEARMGPPERLVAMQADGKLGRKSGEGFYTYE